MLVVLDFFIFKDLDTPQIYFGKVSKSTCIRYIM